MVCSPAALLKIAFPKSEFTMSKITQLPSVPVPASELTRRQIWSSYSSQEHFGAWVLKQLTRASGPSQSLHTVRGPECLAYSPLPTKMLRGGLEWALRRQSRASQSTFPHLYLWNLEQTRYLTEGNMELNSLNPLRETPWNKNIWLKVTQSSCVFLSCCHVLDLGSLWTTYKPVTCVGF